MTTKYQKALRAAELAEDYVGRVYAKLPARSDEDVIKAVKAALRAVRKARDKVQAADVIERSQQ
jgi:predicted HAD superfamily Cof-like phosphohydrolase